MKGIVFRVACAALVVGLLGPSVLARTPASTETRELHSYSSVHPYLVHALQDCQCRGIDDAFDQRDCKKQCVRFKKKMFSWAAKHPVLHHDLEVDVAKYNFKSRSFTLQHDVLIVEAEKVPGSVVIGKGRCDTLTGMPMVGQRIVAKMKERDAKRSILRGMDEASGAAVLVGKLSTMNWCCDAYTKREAALDGLSCNGRVFRYTIKELAIGPSEPAGVDPEEEEEISWTLGFKRPARSIDFEPSMIGYEDVPGDLAD